MYQIIKKTFQNFFVITSKSQAEQFILEEGLNLKFLIVLKTKALQRYSQDVINIPAYHYLIEAISLAHNAKIQKIKKDFNNKLSKMNPCEVFKDVVELLESYSKKKHFANDNAKRCGLSDQIPMDPQGNIIEPLAFYSEVCEYLLQLKTYLSYIIIRNTTPIKDRLKESISDFLLIDWKQKVAKEAENSLDYYQEIQTALIKIRNGYIKSNHGLIFPVINPLYNKVIGSNNLQEIIDWISSKINRLSTRQHKKPVKYPCSFTLIPKLAKPQIIELLFNHLKTNGFISQDTHLPDFRKIWIGEPVTKKTVWTGRTSELAFFIRHLISQKVLEKTKNNSHWKVTVQCFSFMNQKTINPDLLRHAHSPSSTFELEKISQCLTNL